MTNWKSPRCGQACWDEIRQHEAEREDMVKRLVGKIKDETAWLVEINEPVSGPLYYQLEDDNDWTVDENKALRLARREDAQKIIDYYGWTRAKAVEHMWCSPSPSVSRPNSQSEA